MLRFLLLAAAALFIVWSLRRFLRRLAGLERRRESRFYARHKDKDKDKDRSDGQKRPVLELDEKTGEYRVKDE